MTELAPRLIATRSTRLARKSRQFAFFSHPTKHIAPRSRFVFGCLICAGAFDLPPSTGARLMPCPSPTHTAATHASTMQCDALSDTCAHQTIRGLMPCLTRAHKQAAGAKLPEDLMESMDSVEPHLTLAEAQSAEDSEALWQIGTASAKLNFAGIIAVMNAYPDVARIQVCVCVCVCVWHERVSRRLAHAGFGSFPLGPTRVR